MTKKGFGTKFHHAYHNSPDQYHKFSSAEKFSPKLFKSIKQKLSGETLLDVACGTCHKTNILSRYFERTYALDISSEMLDYARHKYGKNKQISYIRASADRIPLLDRSIGTIFISWGSFPLSGTLKEIERVLEPGGSILRIGTTTIDNFTRLFPKFDSMRIKQIDKTFTKMGYKKEYHWVPIEFKSLRESKEILSKVLGIPKGRITSKSLQHRIALYHYKKPKKL